MTWLGIDLGTSSVKVAVLDEVGQVLEIQSASYPTHQPVNGAAEQDPEDWWRATGEAVSSLHPDVRSRVEAIGLSGQMHGTVGLSHHLQLLRPAIIWADTRSGEQARALTDSIGTETLAETVGTALASGFQVASLAWLRDREPQIFSAIGTVLLPKDYLRFRLTGDIASEPSDAASTGMLRFSSRQWAPSMLNAIGIDSACLPQIVKSGSVVGTLTHAAQQHLGFERPVPVAAGGGDASLAAIGTGIAHEDQALITLSSGAQVTVFARHPYTDSRLRVHTFASPLDPDAGECGWYVMGATMSAGTSLHWARHVLGLRSETIESCMSMASEAPPGADGLVFVPYLSGERTPHMDADARGAFVGLSANHDRRHMMRAVLEGTVFAIVDAWDVVTELTGEPRDVVVAGGGARSDLWTQIVSNVLVRDLRTSAVADASAVGAAVLAASSQTGRTASEISQDWSRFGSTVQPQPASVDTYGQLRPVYTRYFEAFSDCFPILKGLAR